MSDVTDWLQVRLRLLGGRQFQADAVAAGESLRFFGDEAETAAGKTELTRIETFGLHQGLYTLRRELFYGTAGVLAFAAGVGKLGFSFDDARAQGEGAFTAILGSAAAARREVATLIDLTHSTGLQLGSLTADAEQLANFGISIGDVNSELRNLALFAQSFGLGAGGLSSLVDVFGQIADSGQLTSVNLRTLRSEGVPALQILRRELHLTADQLKEFKAGQLVIPSSIALPALAAGMGQLARSRPTPFGQLLGMFRADTANIAGDLGQSLVGGATGLLTRVDAAMVRGIRGFSRGGFNGLLLGLDPGGRLLRDWQIFTTDLQAAGRVLSFVWQVVKPGIPLIGAVLSLFGMLAGNTHLVTIALSIFAAWWLITRTRMLAMWITTRVLTAGYWLLGRAITAQGLILQIFGGEAEAATGSMIALDAAAGINPFVLLAEGLAATVLLFIEFRRQIMDAVDWLGRFFGILDSHNHFSWSGFFAPPSLHSIGSFFKPPGLASGGTTTSAGTVMVGENGPEVLRLPRGASVIPLERTGALAGGIKLPPIQAADVNIDGRKVAVATFSWLQTMEATG